MSIYQNKSLLYFLTFVFAFIIIVPLFIVPVKASDEKPYTYNVTFSETGSPYDTVISLSIISNVEIVVVDNTLCISKDCIDDVSISITGSKRWYDGKYSYVDSSVTSKSQLDIYGNGTMNINAYLGISSRPDSSYPNYVYYILANASVSTSDMYVFNDEPSASNYFTSGDSSGAIFKPETTDVLEYDSSIELPQSMTATYNIYSDKDFVDINDVQKVLQVAIKSITNNFYNNMVWSQSVDTTDYITEFYGSATINLPSFLKLTNPTVSDIYNCTTESLDIFFPLLNSDDDSLTINTSSSNAVTYNFRQYYKSLFKYLIDNDYVNCTTYSEENFVSSLRDLIQMTTIDNDTTCHVFVRNRVDNKVSNWVSFKWGSSVQNWNEISAVDKDGNVSDSPASNDVVTDSQYTPTYTPPTEVEEANTNSFLAFIKSGFGLLGDNGLIAMFQSIFLFLPSWLFSLLATGVSSMVLVAIIKAVVK